MLTPDRSKLIIWTYYKRTSSAILGYLEGLQGGWGRTLAWIAKSPSRSSWRTRGVESLVAQPRSAGMGLEPQHVCWENLFRRTLHFALGLCTIR